VATGRLGSMGTIWTKKKTKKKREKMKERLDTHRPSHGLSRIVQGQ
jgi:hypothetical protein